MATSPYRTSGMLIGPDGKPYVEMSDGTKLFLSPRAVDPYAEFGGGGGVFRGGAQWNAKTGEVEHPINWGNIMAMGIGGAIAAPLVAGAVGAGAAGAGGAGSAGAGGGAVGGGAAAGGVLPALAAPAAVLPAGGAGIIGGAGAAGAAGIGGGAAAGGVLPALSAPAAVLPAGGTGLIGGAGAAGAGAGLAPLASSTVAGSGGTAAVPGAGMVSGVGGTGATGGVLGALDKVKPYADTAQDVGDIFSQGAGASALGRRADNENATRAAAANNLSKVNVGTFNLNAPTARAQQTAKGDLMSAAYTPVTSVGGGRNLSFTGGLDRSHLDATTAAGNELKKQALLALMTGSDKITPELATQRQAGAGENIMAGVGLGANVLGTVAKARR